MIMKNLRRSMKIFCAIITITIMTMSVSAITDPCGDIWQWKQTGAEWGWESYDGEKGYIDIIETSYSIEDSTVTLTMTVNDPIQNAATIFYYIHMVFSDAFYGAVYSSGVGWWYGAGFRNQPKFP
jgi:hypothetical protein